MSPESTSHSHDRALRRIATRWFKFNAVGGLGIGVQLGVLLFLKSGCHLSYLTSAALAVEAAVLHNFLWHERYTWADRMRPSWKNSPPRLLRFNLTTGAISIAGNLALMKLLVGYGHMNYLVANGVAIVVCSLANFLVSEEWVFRTEPYRHQLPTYFRDCK
jgi:putative flippase GtrA